MNWFLNMSTRNKLFVGFGLLMLCLAGVIGTAYQSISSIQTSQRSLYQREFANALDLLDIRSDTNGNRAALLSMMIAPNQSDRESWHQEIDRRSKEIADALQHLLERNHDDSRYYASIETLKSMQNEFAKIRDHQIIPLIYAGRNEQAQAFIYGAQAERYRKMRELAEELGNTAQDRARAAVLASEHRAAETVRHFTVIGISALLLGLGMGLWLNHVIASPLQAVSRLAGQVANGNLTAEIPTHSRRDEVGELVRAFRDMVSNLRQTTRDLHDSVSVLASSSSEILATTTQVASTAAETATAVSETTATVEEVKQTAQLTTQKARSVSDTAQRVALVSQTGRKAVDDTIAGMHRIQEHMESIANSIVRLSEQSQAIGEIIATVNDLAEQSNVLAVNAAIEANKAGEHGKGFAIVAQEVKSLAQQSKQATAQVRSILGEIQKATTAAVLATEQGDKAVEAGVKQSAEANDAIRQLAESINEAAEAATQIAATSKQQMVGMDQVALAMDNIKQASSQNAAGTRQAESAAHTLHELGLRLKQLAEKFKVQS